jgi:acetyl-CoA C-acetyltransferase
LWEALLDPAHGRTMGDTAEKLARRYQITRGEVDEFAARSFDRAPAARELLDGETVPLDSKTFSREGMLIAGLRCRARRGA